MASYIPGNRIGEYIHYKYENYMRYGLARKLSEQKKPVRSLNKYLHEARSEAYAMAEKAK